MSGCSEPTELIARLYISKAIANIMFFFYLQKDFKKIP